MKFSIIIPIFNAQKYIESCVNLILQQTYNDFEIVLVNDGSTDESAQICDELELKDTRIKVIHKSNGGVSSARNIGMEFAKGEYILFVDADDTLENNVLSIANGIVANNKTDIISFGINIIRNEKCTDVWSMQNFETANLKDLKKYMHEYIKYVFASTCNKVYKNDIIKMYDLKFDEEMTISEDVCFNINYYSNISIIVNLQQAFYNYHLDDNDSVSRKGRKDIIDACNARINMFEQFFVKIGYEIIESKLYLNEELSRAVVNQFFQAYLTSTKFSRKERYIIIRNICENITHKKMLCKHLKSDYPALEYKIVLALLKSNLYTPIVLIVQLKSVIKKILKMKK